MEKKLLVEHSTLVDAKQDGKTLYLTGVFMEANNQNGNGRVYDMATLKEVEKKINEAAEAGNGILGELDHPSSLIITTANVAIQLKKAWIEENKLYCKAMVLPTPSGEIVRKLYDAGVKLGVSTRGAGNIIEGKVTDYEFVTVDVVTTPSVASAMPEAVYEGYQISKGGSLAEAIRNDEAAQSYFKDRLLEALKQAKENL